ncbi:tryptophan synthase subunit alpha [Sphingomonas xanthus]|uniref:Tryptophan synthase alpha chain n=1 Tax=Sphingomonas xanthus TaxID=2594473 RepID=A0A516ISV2_9SPHN|nr:tryptophan synthase subunit alpha [Sphingomonas xanthus]QDP19939.1 tryptophan synthase subunit alpha [Sphingomonas xanthus]
MTRYEAMFANCRTRGEGVLGGFLMLGDPGRDSCLAYLDALVAGGCDMVEVGIPFSDPVADGPVIQAAAERALKAGIRTADCLAIIAEFRARHPAVAVGVLTYANIVAARGTSPFCDQLAQAGVDSLLVADVPSIEAGPYQIAAKAAGVDLVMIAATNTPEATLRRIASIGSGYTYCVARAGVTGASHRLSLADHGELFATLARCHAAPPILGFGIATPDHVAEALTSGAAGVISGSAIVDMIGRRAAPGDVQRFVAALKGATRPAKKITARL